MSALTRHSVVVGLQGNTRKRQGQSVMMRLAAESSMDTAAVMEYTSVTDSSEHFPLQSNKVLYVVVKQKKH
jgi:hypothetical protein